jgi:hypothetical protein
MYDYRDTGIEHIYGRGDEKDTKDQRSALTK